MLDFRSSLENSITFDEQYVKGIQNVQMALFLSKEYKLLDNKNPYAFLTAYAWNYFRNGNFVKAKYLFEYWFRESIKTVGIFSPENLFSLKGLLRTYRRLGLLDQALEYGKVRALLAKQVGDKLAWNESWSLKGGVYLEQGKIDEAKDSLLSGLVGIDYEASSFINRNYTFEGLFLCGIAKGEIQKSREYYEALVEMEIENSKREKELQSSGVFMLRSSCVKGRYFNSEGKYLEAFEIFKDAFEEYLNSPSTSVNDSYLQGFYQHMLATLINLGEQQDLEYAVKMIHHAMNYVIQRCVESFDILDEESRYFYLKDCRHIMSLINTFVVRNTHCFTSQEIVEITLIMKNICNEATYFHISQLEGYDESYRELYSEWLELRDKEKIKYPKWSVKLLMMEDNQRQFDIEYKLLLALSKIDKTTLIEKFNLDKIKASLDSDEVIFEYGSFYHTNGQFNENNHFYNDIGLPSSEGFELGK